MTVLSSRKTTENAVKETLCEMINTLISDGIVKAENFEHLSSDLSLEEITDNLIAANLECRITFMEMSDQINNLLTAESFMKLEIVELHSLLSVASSAIDNFLDVPPYDIALDEATTCFIDNLLNLGPFKMDFNDKIVVDDTASIDTRDVKDLLRVTIAAWLERKSSMKIV